MSNTESLFIRCFAAIFIYFIPLITWKCVIFLSVLFLKLFARIVLYFVILFCFFFCNFHLFNTCHFHVVYTRINKFHSNIYKYRAQMDCTPKFDKIVCWHILQNSSFVCCSLVRWLVGSLQFFSLFLLKAIKHMRNTCLARCQQNTSTNLKWYFSAHCLSIHCSLNIPILW